VSIEVDNKSYCDKEVEWLASSIQCCAHVLEHINKSQVPTSINRSRNTTTPFKRKENGLKGIFDNNRIVDCKD
jgi:hypothetical protein